MNKSFLLERLIWATIQVIANSEQYFLILYSVSTGQQRKLLRKGITFDFSSPVQLLANVSEMV